MDPQIASFKEKLDQEHTFPGTYIFKFIAPSEKIHEVEALLPAGKSSFRKSSGNTYTSITLHAEVENSQEVIDVYLLVKGIEGVIAL